MRRAQTRGVAHVRKLTMSFLNNSRCDLMCPDCQQNLANEEQSTRLRKLLEHQFPPMRNTSDLSGSDEIGMIIKTLEKNVEIAI